MDVEALPHEVEIEVVRVYMSCLKAHTIYAYKSFIYIDVAYLRAFYALQTWKQYACMG